MISISVLIPVYQSGDKLRSCIESILNQEVLPDEILIFDDCPENSMCKIVNSYSSPLISYKINKVNLGRTNNYRHLIDSSASEYLLILDGDDNLVNKSFIKQAKNILSENDFVIFSGGAKLVRKNDIIEKKLVSSSRSYSGYSYFKKWINAKQTLPHASTIFKKDIVIQQNLYSKDIINTDIISQRTILLFGDIFLSNELFSQWNYTGSNASDVKKLKELIENYNTILIPFKFALKIKGFSLSLFKWFFISSFRYFGYLIKTLLF